MSLAELRAIAAPPTAPQGTGDARRWAAVEQRLGLRLPPDYRDLVDTYGAGRFGNFITVFTPFVDNGYVNLLTQDTLALDAYRVMRADFPETAPDPVYPEPGGVLPWAQTDNGDVVYWRTDGPSERWPVVVIESRFGMHEQYTLTTTAFLAKLLDGTLGSEILPARPGRDRSPRFEPLACQGA